MNIEQSEFMTMLATIRKLNSWLSVLRMIQTDPGFYNEETAIKEVMVYQRMVDEFQVDLLDKYDVCVPLLSGYDLDVRKW